jgi:hypothetical protein
VQQVSFRMPYKSSCVMATGLPQLRHDSLSLGKEVGIKNSHHLEKNLPLFAVGHFVDNHWHNCRKPRQQGLSGRCLKNSQHRYALHFKSIRLPMGGKTVVAISNVSGIAGKRGSPP